LTYGLYRGVSEQKQVPITSVSVPKGYKPPSGSPPSNTRGESNARYCRNCGKVLQYEDTKFCPSCGKSVSDSSSPSSTYSSVSEYPNVVRQLPYKSPGTAALIAFIGGIFGLCGIGHMYVGKVGMGIGILVVGLVMYGLSLLAFGGGGGLAILGLFGLGYVVLWIWQIFKARSLARIFNESVKTSGKEPW
jgi:TM2 domain-containing membrane protein YozV/ribosomal protein L37E